MQKLMLNSYAPDVERWRGGDHDVCGWVGAPREGKQSALKLFNTLVSLLKSWAEAGCKASQPLVIICRGERIGASTNTRSL